MADERETARALGISVQAQVDNGRQIVLQTHVDANAPKEEIDALLDKLNMAADRQAAFYEIPQLQKAVRLEHDRLHLFETNYAQIEERKALKDQANGQRRRNPQEDAKEAVEKTNATNNLSRQKEIIAEVEANLADAQRRAGERYGGTTSPANH